MYTADVPPQGGGRVMSSAGEGVALCNTLAHAKRIAVALNFFELVGSTSLPEGETREWERIAEDAARTLGKYGLTEPGK